MENIKWNLTEKNTNNSLEESYAQCYLNDVLGVWWADVKESMIA